MTTKTFENATSRAVEDAVLCAIRETWRVLKWRRLEDFAAADFGIRTPEEQVIVEIKGRSRAFLGNYRVEIAVKKIEATRLLGREYGCRAILMFAFLYDRSVYWIDTKDVDLSGAYMGGRKERSGSANDRELMVDIPVGWLTPLGATIDGGVADEAIRWNADHRE